MIWKKLSEFGASAGSRLAGLGSKFMALSTAKKVIAGVVAAAVAGTTVTGGVVLASQSDAPMELEAVIEENTEFAFELETEELETEEVTETETETEEEDWTLRLVGVSIGKDLKVRIENSASELITGEEFEISVAKDEEGAKEETYADEDKDGIIYIEKIDAGDYIVTLTGMPEDSEYIVPEPIKVTVKDKITYEAVDVKAEVKKDSQVSAAEDAEKNNSIPVESTPAETAAAVETLTGTSTATQVSGSSITVNGLPQATITTGTASATLNLGTETVTTGSDTSETPATDNTDTSTTNDAGSGTTDSTSETPTTGVATLRPVTRLFLRAAETQEVAKTATLTYPTGATLYNGAGATTASGTVTVSPAVDGLTVAWASADAGIVKVDGNGLSFTLTAVGVGKTSITAIFTYNGKEAGRIDFPAEVLDLSGTTLTDSAGNTLYLDEACTVIATAKDYSATATYYLPPTAGSSNGGVRSGIDVSKWNGNINWSAVKASGVDFAIIRVGYRGSVTGALVEDPTFRQNIQGATAAGIRVGVYFFTQAVNEYEAIEEASMCLQWCAGYNLAFPIFIDTEDGARAQLLDRNTRTTVINAFCRTIAEGGRRPGVYASTSWYNTKLNAGSLSGSTIWVAQYAAACKYTGSYSMWQYSSKGTVPGISGYVDMNISYI